MPLRQTASRNALPLPRVGTIDDFRVHRGADGVEDVAAGQVDGGGRFPRQIHAGLVGRDDRRRGFRHVAASQKVRFQFLGPDQHAGLNQGDLLADDHGVIDVSQLHADQIDDADLRSGQQTLDPEPDEAEEDNHHEDANQQATARMISTQPCCSMGWRRPAGDGENGVTSLSFRGWRPLHARY